MSVLGTVLALCLSSAPIKCKVGSIVGDPDALKKECNERATLACLSYLPGTDTSDCKVSKDGNCVPVCDTPMFCAGTKPGAAGVCESVFFAYQFGSAETNAQIADLLPKATEYAKQFTRTKNYFNLGLDYHFVRITPQNNKGFILEATLKTTVETDELVCAEPENMPKGFISCTTIATRDAGVRTIRMVVQMSNKMTLRPFRGLWLATQKDDKDAAVRVFSTTVDGMSRDGMSKVPAEPFDFTHEVTEENPGVILWPVVDTAGEDGEKAIYYSSYELSTTEYVGVSMKLLHAIATAAVDEEPLLAAAEKALGITSKTNDKKGCYVIKYIKRANVEYCNVRPFAVTEKGCLYESVLKDLLESMATAAPPRHDSLNPLGRFATDVNIQVHFTSGDAAKDTNLKDRLTDRIQEKFDELISKDIWECGFEFVPNPPSIDEWFLTFRSRAENYKLDIYQKKSHNTGKYQDLMKRTYVDSTEDDRKSLDWSSSTEPCPSTKNAIESAVTAAGSIDDLMEKLHTMKDPGSTARVSPATLMANTPANAAAKACSGLDPKQHYEWLHRVAHSIADRAADDPRNLMFGTNHANSQMMTYEHVARNLPNNILSTSIKYEKDGDPVFAPLYLTYDVVCGGDPWFLLTFNLRSPRRPSVLNNLVAYQLVAMQKEELLTKCEALSPKIKKHKASTRKAAVLAEGSEALRIQLGLIQLELSPLVSEPTQAISDRYEELKKHFSETMDFDEEFANAVVKVGTAATAEHAFTIISYVVEQTTPVVHFSMLTTADGTDLVTTTLGFGLSDQSLLIATGSVGTTEVMVSGKAALKTTFDFIPTIALAESDVVVLAVFQDVYTLEGLQDSSKLRYVEYIHELSTGGTDVYVPTTTEEAAQRSTTGLMIHSPLTLAVGVSALPDDGGTLHYNLHPFFRASGTLAWKRPGQDVQSVDLSAYGAYSTGGPAVFGGGMYNLNLKELFDVNVIVRSLTFQVTMAPLSAMVSADIDLGNGHDVIVAGEYIDGQIFAYGSAVVDVTLRDLQKWFNDQSDTTDDDVQDVPSGVPELHITELGVSLCQESHLFASGHSCPKGVALRAGAVYEDGKASALLVFDETSLYVAVTLANFRIGSALLREAFLFFTLTTSGDITLEIFAFVELSQATFSVGGVFSTGSAEAGPWVYVHGELGGMTADDIAAALSYLTGVEYEPLAALSSIELKEASLSICTYPAEDDSVCTQGVHLAGDVGFGEEGWVQNAKGTFSVSWTDAVDDTPSTVSVKAFVEIKFNEHTLILDSTYTTEGGLTLKGNLVGDVTAADLVALYRQFTSSERIDDSQIPEVTVRNVGVSFSWSEQEGASFTATGEVQITDKLIINPLNITISKTGLEFLCHMDEIATFGILEVTDFNFLFILNTATPTNPVLKADAQLDVVTSDSTITFEVSYVLFGAARLEAHGLNANFRDLIGFVEKMLGTEIVTDTTLLSGIAITDVVIEYTPESEDVVRSGVVLTVTYTLFGAEHVMHVSGVGARFDYCFGHCSAAVRDPYTTIWGNVTIGPAAKGIGVKLDFTAELLTLEGIMYVASSVFKTKDDADSVRDDFNEDPSVSSFGVAGATLSVSLSSKEVAFGVEGTIQKRNDQGTFEDTEIVTLATSISYTFATGWFTFEIRGYFSPYPLIDGVVDENANFQILSLSEPLTPTSVGPNYESDTKTKGGFLYFSLSRTPLLSFEVGGELSMRICVDDCKALSADDKEWLVMHGNLALRLRNGGIFVHGRLVLDATFTPSLFGLQFITISNLIVGVDLDLEAEGLPTGMEFGGSVCLGPPTNCENNTSPRIDGYIYVGYNIAKLDENYLLMAVNDLTVSNLIDVVGTYFKEGTSERLKDLLPEKLLDSGLSAVETDCNTAVKPPNLPLVCHGTSTEQSKECTDALKQHFNKKCYAYFSFAAMQKTLTFQSEIITIEQGLSFSGKLNFFGWEGEQTFTFAPSGFEIGGEFQNVDLTIGDSTILQIGERFDANGEVTGNPRLYAAINVDGLNISVHGACSIPMLGATAQVRVDIDNVGFYASASLQLGEFLTIDDATLQWNWDRTYFKASLSRFDFANVLAENVLLEYTAAGDDAADDVPDNTIIFSGKFTITNMWADTFLQLTWDSDEDVEFMDASYSFEIDYSPFGVSTVQGEGKVEKFQFFALEFVNEIVVPAAKLMGGFIGTVLWEAATLVFSIVSRAVETVVKIWEDLKRGEAFGIILELGTYLSDNLMAVGDALENIGIPFIGELYKFASNVVSAVVGFFSFLWTGGKSDEIMDFPLAHLPVDPDYNCGQVQTMRLHYSWFGLVATWIPVGVPHSDPVCVQKTEEALQEVELERKRVAGLDASIKKAKGANPWYQGYIDGEVDAGLVVEDPTLTFSLDTEEVQTRTVRTRLTAFAGENGAATEENADIVVSARFGETFEVSAGEEAVTSAALRHQVGVSHNTELQGLAREVYESNGMGDGNMAPFTRPTLHMPEGANPLPVFRCNVDDEDQEVGFDTPYITTDDRCSTDTIVTRLKTRRLPPSCVNRDHPTCVCGSEFIEVSWSGRDSPRCGGVTAVLKTVLKLEPRMDYDTFTFPEDRTITTAELLDSDELGFPVANTLCSKSVTMVKTDTIIAGTGCEWTVKRVWGLSHSVPATMNCTDTNSHLPSLEYVQIITVRDETAPVWIHLPDSLLYLPFNFHSSTETGVPIAEEQTHMNTMLSFASYPTTLEVVDGPLERQVPDLDDDLWCRSHGLARMQRTWTATDSCGNSRLFEQTLVFEHYISGSNTIQGPLQHGQYSIATGVQEMGSVCDQHHLVRMYDGPRFFDPLDGAPHGTHHICADTEWDGDGCRLLTGAALSEEYVHVTKPQFTSAVSPVTVTSSEASKWWETAPDWEEAYCEGKHLRVHSDVSYAVPDVADRCEVRRIEREWSLRDVDTGCNDAQFVQTVEVVPAYPLGHACECDFACVSNVCVDHSCVVCRADADCAHDALFSVCDTELWSCRPRSMVKIISLKNVVDGAFPSDIIAQGVVNPENPDADTHSIVGNLDKDDFALSDGRYQFELRFTYQSGEESVFVWTQTSWLTNPVITGFVPANMATLLWFNRKAWGTGEGTLHQTLYIHKPSQVILSLKDVADGLFTSGMLATGLENENNPEANAHSIIGTLHRGDLMHGSGYYMFKMHYKLLSGEEQLYTWRQSSWMTDSTVAGYTPVDIPDLYPAFIGLHYAISPYTYLRCSGGGSTWWYTGMGAVRVWGTGARAGIPVATIGSVDLVATSQKLYIYEPEQLKILSLKKGSGTFPSDISNSGVVNPADPDAHQYSIIGKLDKDKFVHAGGFYKFKLHYEMSGGTEQVYVWTQTSWLTDPTVTGFVLIVGPPGSASPAFTGLGLSGTPDKTYLDTNGGVSHYYHAIGIIQLWNGGIPVTTTTVAVSQTLYVFPPQE